MFENYARSYDQESFTQGTYGEVDFIEKEIESDKTKLILDIGCGTGRHDIELAKRGYRVKGVDLSSAQLARAREKAIAAQVDVEFVQMDARKLSFHEEFDLVIMLCEGGFSLMETDEENFAILQGAAHGLKSGGKFIFSALNALFPLHHSVKDFVNQNSDVVSADNNFDLMTFRDYSTAEIIDDAGKKVTVHCNERYYTPSEISWLLKSLGFIKIDILGCPIGGFSRQHPLTTKDFELLVVAEKNR